MTHIAGTTDEFANEARSAIKDINWKMLYSSFDGRITRRSYWFGLAGIAVASTILQSVIFSVVNYSDVAIASAVASLLFVYPLLAVGAKRFHDRNKTGWMQIALAIPVLGALWVLYELGFQPSDEGGNQFGSQPKI